MSSLPILLLGRNKRGSDSERDGPREIERGRRSREIERDIEQKGRTEGEKSRKMVQRRGETDVLGKLK